MLEDNHALQEAVAPMLEPPIEFFQVRLPDGTTLDGSLINPRQFGASKKYPLIVQVYGEPGGTTVTDRWRGSNEPFHRALANDGYLIASFDNRGTPSIRERAYIDPRRIGV